MRILEVRDGFVKLEAKKNIALSSFIQINDTANSYIAQILQVKRAGENSIAYAKILYLYNGAYNNYDGSIPAVDSEILPFNFNLISDSFDNDNAIVIGSFIENEQNISINKEALNKSLLISIDTNDSNKLLVSNLTKQLKKALIIDTLGIFDAPKFVAGVDFKLPLNTDALEFMFEDCLNDATSDSKNLIKEIFQDLADYSRTVPFLPFGALKTIVDEMVDKSHIFKLLVLKNKLAKFDKLGYFAATAQEAENLNKIINTPNAIIDLSKLDSTFLNRYLSIILSTIEKQNLDTQVFIEASNALNKKSLKKILTGKASTAFITHSKFKYINEIKSMFNNFIIEPTFNNNEVFKKYSILLKAMQKDSYLIIGEATNSIPLISALKELSFADKLEIIDIEEPSKDLNNAQFEELEKALENSQEESLNIEETASIQAIEKKSEDLIDKVSEEIQTEAIPSKINIFDDNTEENEDEIVNEITEEDIIASEQLSQEETQTSQRFETVTHGAIVEEDNAIEESIELNATSLGETSSDNTVETIEEINNSEFQTQIDDIQTIEIPEDISDLAEEILDDTEELTFSSEENLSEETENIVIEESADEKELLEENSLTEEISEVNKINLEEPSNKPEGIDEIPITEELEDELDTIVELDESEITDADIIIDFEDEIIEEISEEDIDKAIIEDVDKVFTTMKEDTISDSDLDFIDELNNEVNENEIEEITLSDGMEELAELQESNEDEDAGFLEPLEEINDYKENEPEEKEILETRSASTPIVPVYGAEIPAEDLVLSDEIEQGDTVVHAKYGNGVVEKMIKYGTKTLFSINFDNVGRRLLDPTLTEIKKA